MAEIVNDLFSWDEILQVFTLNNLSLHKKIELERTSRPDRIRKAFDVGQNSLVNHPFWKQTGRDQQIFCSFHLDENIKDLNQELFADLIEELKLHQKEENDKNIRLKYPHYHLMRNLRLISFYYCFGSNGSIAKGRLAEQTEKMLLEVLWERTKYKNDIAVTRNSTWWIAGSENHDLNTKVCNLLSSRIFMAEEDYKNRIYPNLGYGDGIAYGEAGDFSRKEAFKHQAGRADWSDGEQYTARDHYPAWLEYFKEYFTQRAKKGFFLENGSPHYMAFTISYILGLYNFCGDAELKNMIRMFLDLLWTDWAVQQLAGVRGGPKTRHHYEVGGYDAMTEFARFYAGGRGETVINYTQQLISNYQWSDAIWEIVFRNDPAECYKYVSRGIGEENTILPRPKGLERSMLGDAESRFIKYSWVTPDYILGTQMDHPLAVFNHLAVSGRWQGLVTADPDLRLCTVSLDPAPGSNKDGEEYSTEHVFNSVQHQNVLITQQSRRWTQINPDWFPAYDTKYYERSFGIYIGKAWDTVLEKEGWIFTAKNNIYAAIKIVAVESDPNPAGKGIGNDLYKNRIVMKEKSYSWNKDQTILRFSNKFSPAVIEIGRKCDHHSFENFINTILGNTLYLHKTVVTGETGFILVYKGVGKDSENGEDSKEIVFNAANPHDIPTIAGEYLDYQHSRVFDCPWIQSDYNSGIVRLSSGAGSINHTTVLDFNTNEIKISDKLKKDK